MSDTLRLLSPAKLNLFLHINGQRADGYHLLQTLFQILDYGDAMTFSAAEDIELHPSLAGVADCDNLIVRAAHALRTATGFVGGARIGIDKRLPMGGGIGGGSSNAATTLLALNRLWQTGLSLDQLADIGVGLGADVPVFVRGRSAFAEGVGERLTPMDLEAAWFLVLVPPVSVSTAEIFSHKLLTRDTEILRIAAFPKAGAKNDCESLVRNLYPEVDKALVWLKKFRKEARMSGTGACIFARCDSEQEARQILTQAPTALRGFVAQGVNVSPVHRALGIAS